MEVLGPLGAPTDWGTFGVHWGACGANRPCLGRCVSRQCQNKLIYVSRGVPNLSTALCQSQHTPTSCRSPKQPTQKAKGDSPASATLAPLPVAPAQFGISPTPYCPHHHTADCYLQIESIWPSNLGLLSKICVRCNQLSKRNHLGQYLQLTGTTTTPSGAQLLAIILTGIGASLKEEREQTWSVLCQSVKFTS